MGHENQPRLELVHTFQSQAFPHSRSTVKQGTWSVIRASIVLLPSFLFITPGCEVPFPRPVGRSSRCQDTQALFPST